MTSRILALLAATALLSACGSATSTSTTTPPPKQAAVKQAVSTARATCGTVSRNKFASDFGMTTTSPTLLAQRYARAYDERIRPQVQDACLRAMTR